MAKGELTGLAKQQIDNLQKKIDETDEKIGNEGYDTKRYIEDIRKELEHFKQEKERVCSIVGKIGAVPTQRNRLINAIFPRFGSCMYSTFSFNSWHNPASASRDSHSSDFSEIDLDYP
ncbi:MAG: hypothetical protein ACLFSQ_07445 [Candidatus Zixiibacteriota bacterium]